MIKTGFAITGYAPVFARGNSKIDGHRCCLQLVEKEIDGCDPAIPRNDEVGTGISRGLAGAPRHPTNAASVSPLFGFGKRLKFEIRVSRLNRALDAVDLFTASIHAAIRIVEYAIFGEDLVDGRTPAGGVVSPNTSSRSRRSKVDTASLLLLLVEHMTNHLPAPQPGLHGTGRIDL